MKNLNIFSIINAAIEKNSLQKLTKRVLTRRNGKYVVIIEKPVIVLEKTEKGYNTKKVLKKTIL